MQQIQRGSAFLWPLCLSLVILKKYAVTSHLPFRRSQKEVSRDIESERRPKIDNADEVEYRSLVATATSRLDTINIDGQREYKNHIYRYD